MNHEIYGMGMPELKDMQDGERVQQSKVSRKEATGKNSRQIRSSERKVEFLARKRRGNKYML